MCASVCACLHICQANPSARVNCWRELALRLRSIDFNLFAVGYTDADADLGVGIGIETFSIGSLSSSSTGRGVRALDPNTIIRAGALIIVSGNPFFVCVPGP